MGEDLSSFGEFEKKTLEKNTKLSNANFADRHCKCTVIGVIAAYVVGERSTLGERYTPGCQGQLPKGAPLEGQLDLSGSITLTGVTSSFSK